MLGELLGGERRPEVRELAAQESDDAAALVRGELPRAGSPAVAVDEARGAVGLVGALPEADGAIRDAEERCRLALREATVPDVAHDLELLQLLGGHREEGGHARQRGHRSGNIHFPPTGKTHVRFTLRLSRNSNVKCTG